MTTTSSSRTQIRTRVYLVLAIRRVALTGEAEHLTYRRHQLDLTATDDTLAVALADAEDVAVPVQTAATHEGSLAAALSVEAAIDSAAGEGQR